MSKEFVMPPLQAGFRVDVATGIERMPASRLIGLKVVGFAPEGVSVIELPIRAELTFDGSVVQGGIVGMLADYAGVSAAVCTLLPGWMASTTGFEIHNLAPAMGTRLVAIGRAEHVGKSHAVSRAEVWAFDGETANLVALATTTCRPFEVRPA